MLKLQNIHVQLAKSAFKPNSQKYLRVSIGNSVKNTSSPGRFVNAKSIDWTESLTLPLLYNKDYEFQIYDKHDFGYNPQEFVSLMKGRLSIIDDSQKHNTWEIYTSKQQRLGFLSASISVKGGSLMRKETIEVKQKNQSAIYAPPEKKVLRIVSIVARMPNSHLRKGYIVVQVGSEIIQTKAIRSRSGELVFIDAHQIALQSSDTDARIKVYSIDANGEQILIGEGTLELIGPKPPKKVVIIKDGFEAGEAYIDSRIMDESQAKNLSMNHSKIFNNNSRVMNQSASSPQKSNKNNSRSIDFTRLEDFGIEQTSRIVKPVLDLSMHSTFNMKKQRNSVLQHNNNVRFPKEKRFIVYQDKQNQRVTYLRDRSFEFSSPGSDKNYKGKSMGYGDKVDFTRGKKDIPGVGNYRLPSIWDRY